MNASPSSPLASETKPPHLGARFSKSCNRCRPSRHVAVMNEPRLSDRRISALRTRSYSPRTEEAYLYWFFRYVRFHELRHPRDLGADELAAFLSHLAVVERCAPATQNQALAALLFLYRHVLGIDLPWLDDLVRARAAEQECRLRHPVRGLGGDAAHDRGGPAAPGCRDRIRLRVAHVESDSAAPSARALCGPGRRPCAGRQMGRL